MSTIKIDLTDIGNAHELGTVMSQYFLTNTKRDEFNGGWGDLPDVIQKYFYYVTAEEVKELTVFTSDGFIFGEFKGDRVIDTGDNGVVCAPYVYTDKIWLYSDGESIRFEMDLEDN